MPLKIKSASGGSVTIDVPATAVDTTLFLPVSNGAAIYSNTNTAFSGNVSVSGANSYISINGSNVSPFAMRNRIINGDFRIWQRGTGAITTLNSYTYTNADRFFGFSGVGANAQYSQVTSTGLSEFPYAIRCQRQSGNTGTNDILISQIIETQNCIDLAGQTVTLSFYARAGANFSAASNALKVYFVTGSGTDQGMASSIGQSWTSYLAALTGTATLTTSWQRFSYSYTLPSNTSELSFYLLFDGTGTAGAADYFDATGIQLEAGSVATPFEHRFYGMEMSLCQRYYVNLSFAAGLGSTIGMTCNVTSGTNYHFSFQFPTIMRAAPTMTWTEWTSSNFPGTSAIFQQTGPGGTNVYKQANGTGSGYYLGGYIASAEL